MDPGTQQFWLTLATMFFSFLTTAGAGYIAWRQREADKDREFKQNETRENIGEVARAIEGASTTQAGAEIAKQAQQNILGLPTK